MTTPLKYILLSVCLFLCSCQPFYSGKSAPKAVNGVLDLAKWNFSLDGTLPLDGEWEFYWEQLLLPKDFKSDPIPQKTGGIPVPSVWNQYELNGEALTGDGYATIRLEIQNLPNEGVFALKVPPIQTAYQLWINDKKLASSGTVGTRRDLMIPDYRPRTIYFDNHKGSSLNILIQISNFHHKRGGTHLSFILGKDQQIHQRQIHRESLDLFLLGSVLIMGIYHFGLFALRRTEPSALFFGLFCMDIAIRVLTTGENRLLFSVFSPWEVPMTVDYLSLYVAPPLFILFLHSLFPKEFWTPFLKFSVGLAILFSVVTIFVPARIYSGTMLTIYQLIAVAHGLYAILVMGFAIFRKRDGALLLLFGVLVLFVTMINDILHSQLIIQTGHILSWGFFIFIFFQSVVLSKRFSRAFTLTEKLTKSYERFVPHEFLEHLEKADILEVSLGNYVEKHMSILFSDIRDFTTLSESMTPEENFKFVNSVLKGVGPIIRNHDGFIDKYIGDAIMALFDQEPEDAVGAAVEILKSLDMYNQYRQRSGYSPIQISIGINTGEVMLGTIGEHGRMEGTVIGDTVNLAARMEGLTKMYGASLLISDQTYHGLPNASKFTTRFIDKVAVKGKKASVKVFEVLDGEPIPIREKKIQTLPQFEDAIALYYSQRFQESLDLFEACLTTNPDDQVSQIYVSRCQSYIHNERSWDSVTHLEIK